MRWSDSAVRRVSLAAVSGAAVSVLLGVAAAAFAADNAAVPDFSSGGIAWLNTHNDFIRPATGPGPVTWDPAHPYFGNGDGPPPTSRVADLTNPILMPWVRDALKKFNDEALSGKPQFTPIARCWPSGVPGNILLRVNPMFIVQTPGEVLFLYQSDHQVRHIYMNRPHAKDIQPSWYGESVGHYEGDTLVVDTVGISTKVPVEYYLTPHTDKLHVVERYRMIEGGKVLEVTFTVDDPGAFNMAWSASQRYTRQENTPMREVVCAEGEAFAPIQDPQQGLVPIPRAQTADF
jgi:hypothetical protein